MTLAVFPGMSYVYAIHGPLDTESNKSAETLSTMISHRLGIPMVSDAPSHWMLDWYHWRMRQSIELKSTSRTIIVADAICDSGKTIDLIITPQKLHRE